MIDIGVQRLWEPRPGWLNTTTYGLPPRATVEALRTVIDQWQTGASSWEEWEPAVGEARSLFAEMVNVPVDTVATGAAVSVLAACAAVVQPRAGRALDAGRLSARTGIGAGLGLTAAGLACAMVPGLTGVLLAAALIGVGTGLITPLGFATLAAGTPRSGRWSGWPESDQRPGLRSGDRLSDLG